MAFEIYRPARLRLAGLAVLAILILAGCQTSASFMTESETVIGPSAATYGAGGFPIGILLPQASDGSAQDYLEGIKLGADLLGQDAFTLVIRRTNGSRESAQSTLADFLAFQTGFILGPSTAVDLAALPRDLDIPILAFLDPAASQAALSGCLTKGAPLSDPNPRNAARRSACCEDSNKAACERDQGDGATSGPLLTFLTDAIDGLNEAIRATLEAGRGDILVLRSEATSQRDRARVEDYIADKGGKLVGSFGYDARPGKVLASLRAHRKAIASAEVVALIGSDAAVKNLLDVMRAEGLRNTGVTLITVHDSTQLSPADPLYDQIVYAQLPSPDPALIAEAFDQKYGRAPSRPATYGFDAMAMLAGLHRSGELTAPSKDELGAALKKPAGFRALNGHFRFRPDGSVERRHEIYQINNQKAVLVQEIGAGF